MGNTLVLKPSERDPGAAIIIASLAKEAGFPPGVVNVIHGTHRAVNFLLNAPEIKAVSFVGSNKAGEYIHARASANGKRVQANLGAKNHAIVLPDCNKQHALSAIAGAAFGAAGQRCMALSVVLFVGETKEWLPELVEIAKKLKVDAGFEDGADLGPVISPHSKERIERLIASAEGKADILLDGRGYKVEKYPNGNFVSVGSSILLFERVVANTAQVGPTVIANVTTDMECYREEIFGPVLITLSVPSLAEAISIVNANEYGNGVALFTNSGASAGYFQKNIEAGKVGINVPIPVPLPMFSFTGNKRSVAGGGTSTFYGKPGLNFYTQTKTVTSLWRAEDSNATAVNMPTHS